MSDYWLSAEISAAKKLYKYVNPEGYEWEALSEIYQTKWIQRVRVVLDAYNISSNNEATKADWEDFWLSDPIQPKPKYGLKLSERGLKKLQDKIDSFIIKRDGRATPEIHAAHCCYWHGCVYGDTCYCPIVTGDLEQEIDSCIKCEEEHTTAKQLAYSSS